MYTSISVEGSNIYISYMAQYISNKDTFLKFAKSTDYGETWPTGNIKNIDTSTNVVDPSIFVNGSDIYISYYYNLSLKFAKSSDYGETWPSENFKIIDSYDGDHFIGQNSSLSCEGSNIYISYLSYAYYDINISSLKFVKSTDSGNTWLNTNIRYVDPIISNFDSLASNNGNLFISYYDIKNNHLKFAKSTDDGDTWTDSNKKNVDSNLWTGGYSSISFSDNNIFICYTNLSIHGLIFVSSNDEGDTWH
jgi:hypothetical protein